MRFIRKISPGLEFGLVGKTMHKVDEAVSLKDLKFNQNLQKYFTKLLQLKTALISSDTYQNHDTGPGHPEQIARVTVINENLKKLNNKNILWKKPSIITEDIIKDTHDISYVDFVKILFQLKDIHHLMVIQ